MEKSLQVYNTTIGWIVFEDTSFLDSWLWRISQKIKSDSVDEIKINEKRSFVDIWLWYYLIKYNDKTIRDKDISDWKYIGKPTNKKIQTPIVHGKFEYNNEYYSIIDAHYALLGETNDVLYKGMVMDPEKYLKDQQKDTWSHFEQKDVEWIQIKSVMNVSETQLKDIANTIKNMEDEQYYKENADNNKYIDGRYVNPLIREFDGERILHIMKDNLFLVKYNNKELRDTDMKEHTKDFLDSYMLQTPNIYWYVDYNWKYFLILKARKDLEWDTNKRTYGWLIINPNISSTAWYNINTQIKDILDSKK